MSLLAKLLCPYCLRSKLSPLHLALCKAVRS
jgi:hypothetical protein